MNPWPPPNVYMTREGILLALLKSHTPYFDNLLSPLPPSGRGLFFYKTSSPGGQTVREVISSECNHFHVNRRLIGKTV